MKIVKIHAERTKAVTLTRHIVSWNNTGQPHCGWDLLTWLWQTLSVVPLHFLFFVASYPPPTPTPFPCLQLYGTSLVLCLLNNREVPAYLDHLIHFGRTCSLKYCSHTTCPVWRLKDIPVSENSLWNMAEAIEAVQRGIRFEDDSENQAYLFLFLSRMTD